MSGTKKIQCPSCGASSVFRLNPEEYKCNYCQTTFLVGEERPEGVPPDLNEVLKKVKIEAYKTQLKPLPAKKLKSGCILFVAMFITMLAGVLVFVFTTKSSPRAGKNSSLPEEWGNPSLNRYLPFTGSKGTVIWQILEFTHKGLDSSKHVLRIVDPLTGNIKSENVFDKTTTWSENFNFNKRVGYDYLMINDTLYNGSEDGGLQAFDLYTGKKILSNSDFEKRFSEFKSGISKVESRVYNKLFEVTTNNGDEFYYYPVNRKIYTKEQENDAYKTDTITRQNFYFSEGKKPNLYLVTKKEGRNENGSLSDYYINAYNNNDKYIGRYLKKMEKLSDKIYPNAQRLISNKDFVIFAYMSDFSKKARPIIEKIDYTGKTIWQNNDTAFYKFIDNFSSDNLYLNYNYSKTQIVFCNTGAGYKSIGINLDNGKTTFVHRQSYNIN